jgi:hypothetical protein
MSNVIGVLIFISIVGASIAMIIAIVRLLTSKGGSKRRTGVPHWGYGPKGPYGNWSRDPWTVGERVTDAIEEGRIRSSRRHSR